MKIKPSHLYSPKSTLGVKRKLLALNLDLDSVKEDIQFNKDYGWYFPHSISTHSEDLTNVEVAILYLEDRRFFSHGGFEFRSLLRGIKRYIMRGSLNGMSTIDQQVVRISLRRRERTLGRKVNEIILAVCINMHASKRSIFDYYIHNAYMGHRMEGCEVAARKVFGLSAASLNKQQAAFIASLMPLPFPRSAWEAYSTTPTY